MTDLSNVNQLRAAEEALEALVMALAAGEMPKEWVIAWFRVHAVERPEVETLNCGER